MRDNGEESENDADQRSGPQGDGPGRPPGHEPDTADLPEDPDAPAGLSHPGVGLDGPLLAGGDGPAEAQALIAHQRIVSRSGPLPDPEDLAGFERVLPGCAERIVRMAEKAQEAAIEDGHRSTRAEAFTLKCTGLLFSLAPLVAMGLAAFLGKDAGAAWVVVAVIAITGLPRVVEVLKARPGPSRRDGA